MRARVALAVSSLVAGAHAQWAPPQQQPQQQPTYPQQAPPSYQSQPQSQSQWTPAPQARTGRTEAELKEAERRDAGRGLEWFFVAPELGVTNIGLASLSNNALLPGVGSQTGTQLGLGLGARLLYVTAGLRGRLAFMPDYKMWSVGPEASFHVPMGSWEPFVLAGLGYTSLGAIRDESNVGGIKVRGVNARVGGGADYYFTPGFSVGGLGTAETLFLSRPAIDGASGDLKTSGSSVGLALSASLVLGLHL